MRILTLVIALFAASFVEGQTTAVTSMPSQGRSALTFAYGDLFKFTVTTQTRAQANDFASVRVRLFRGSVETKLTTASYARADAYCFYYETVLIRPAVSRVAPNVVVLDLRRTIGARWAASPAGRPAMLRYTVVFEKASSPVMAIGSSRAETFGVSRNAHDEYFSTAFDLIIDPGRLTAAEIASVPAGAYTPTAPPTDCPSPAIDARQVMVAEGWNVRRPVEMVARRER